jgi:hypothetical protein
MADPRKLLAAKKAAILEQAAKQAAEIDRDLHEMQRLADKYGLEFADKPSEPASASAAAAAAAPKTEQKTRKVRDANSPYYRGKVIAEQMAEAARGPVGMLAIWARMLHEGVIIPGKNPKSKFSAYLGARSRLTYVKDRGWWFANTPVPKPGHPIQGNESKAPGNGELSGASRSNGTLPLVA